MPQKSEDTIPVSIRMPRNSVERIRAATGMPFSTLVRLIMMQLLMKLEAAQARQVHDMSSEIGKIVEEEVKFDGQQP